MNGKERYNIYSCSKPITCTAAMQLWEKGTFSLEDRLAEYIPEFAEMTVRTSEGIVPAKNPIKIRHLFEMTAGLSYDLNSPQLLLAREETRGCCPTRETMRYLAKEPLLFEPGTRWEYSLCHDVLAALVEVISGIPFESYVQKHIFDPLGMTHSTFILPESEQSTLAVQYRYDPEIGVYDIGKGCSYRIGTKYVSGGAGCVSTVDDYICFLEAMRTGDVILSRDTIALMATDRLTDSQRETYWLRDTHGYGLGIRTPGIHPMYGDFGWGGAAASYLAVDRDLGMSLYLGEHILNSPCSAVYSRVYDYACAALSGRISADVIDRELRDIAGYTITPQR